MVESGMGKDLRKYSQQTTARLVIGFVIVLLVVGIGLIYLIYGNAAALMGLLCLAGVLVPVGLIALALWVIDWIVKKNDQSI